MATAIIWPSVALVFLTFAVWATMFARRARYMKGARIALGQMATRGGRPPEPAASGSANDNLLNLFELPTLFHVLCLALAVTGLATGGLVAAAWAFVGLRAVHSLIHVTYNQVAHRFAAYAASTLVLLGMWVAFALRLAG